MNKLDFLLVGVGGQGTILASNILAEIGLTLGYDVKKAEVHGMSQRGGSVISHVRWADHVFSPTISDGDVDVLLSFEKMEVVRYFPMLKPNALALINDYSIVPVTVHSGNVPYPEDKAIDEISKKFTQRIFWIKCVEMAEELGNTRAANTVMLGSLSALLDTQPEQWQVVIERLVPAKARELNVRAFEVGRKFIRA